jgi:hypothetical protein
MSESEEMDYLVMGRRKAAFVTAGCHPEEAAELAYHMMVRDRENRGSTNPLDDRRVCFECKGLSGRDCLFVKDKKGKPIPPLRFHLQRCPQFELKGKK